MQKTFVIGDIHGAYKALKQCLERSRFDYTNDVLIQLGDVADGWSETSQCVDELLKIKRLIAIRGNHDTWLLDFLDKRDVHPMWLSQGGQASKDNYINSGKIMDQSHIDFFKNQTYYYVDENNRLFVHGGYDWKKPIEEQDKTDLTWDRHLWGTVNYWQQKELGYIIKDYSEIFIGHTSTEKSHVDLKPVHISNVWNLDQGAGWSGKLTIMNVDTKEYYQSDIVKTLYVDKKGRF